MYPTYHASELKSFLANNKSLFPSRTLLWPDPVLTPDGLEEYLVEEIIDSWKRGKGHQYLVRWCGCGSEHDRWISGSVLADCKVLDHWQEESGAATP